MASRSTTGEAPQKPWKHNKKKVQSGDNSQFIEIFEGKPAVTNLCSLDVIPAESEYICITCGENHKFVIPLKVVECFECVDAIFHKDVIFKERSENVIRFPDMSPQVMETVLRLVFIEHLNTLKTKRYWGVDSPRIIFQYEVAPGEVMDVLHAAHYLGINSLIDVVASMVAHNLKDMDDLSTLPPDLAWCVAEACSAQELFDAEERLDFAALGLNTESLWENHCKKLLKGDFVNPILCSDLDFYPSYDTWNPLEGLPPLSWKSLYISSYLQHLADRQTGAENDQFLAEVGFKGKYGYNHTVRPMFWEWVVGRQGSSFLPMYIPLFKDLLSLSLAKLPLGIPSEDGVLPCLKIGDVLCDLPQLQYLDVSETDFTLEAAVCLSKSLQRHRRIQALRLAFNRIGTKGFTAIVRILPMVRTLKFLDVRENGISAAVEQDVVNALQISAIEEMLFEGNFKDHSKESSSSSYPPGPLENLRKEVDNYCPSALEVFTFSGLPKNLRHLQLSECEMHDGRLMVLAKGLASSNNIQKLYLSDNKITSKGAILIFLWLQENNSLQELLLENNNITDSCAHMMSNTVRNHKKIERISLKGNFSYGDENLDEVLDAAIERGSSLYNAKKKEFMLDLRATGIPYSVVGRIRRQMNIYINVNLSL